MEEDLLGTTNHNSSGLDYERAFKKITMGLSHVVKMHLENF